MKWKPRNASIEQGNRTYIERLDLTVPYHEIPNTGHGSADEDIILDSNTLGPHGTALLVGFFGVIFQSDRRRLGILDGRIGFIPSMRPIRWDYG